MASSPSPAGAGAAGAGAGAGAGAEEGPVQRRGSPTWLGGDGGRPRSRGGTCCPCSCSTGAVPSQLQQQYSGDGSYDFARA